MCADGVGDLGRRKVGVVLFRHLNTDAGLVADVVDTHLSLLKNELRLIGWGQAERAASPTHYHDGNPFALARGQGALSFHTLLAYFSVLASVAPVLLAIRISR